MLRSASTKQGLRTALLKHQRLSSLTDSLRNMTALYAKREWKSVLAVANDRDVLRFIERNMSNNSPMWSNDRAAIVTVFESAVNCNNKLITGPFIQPFIAQGYDRYHLVASIGADVTTRLCLSYPTVIDPAQLATITSVIEEETIAPNLLLLNLRPPQVQEYLLAGHLNTYTRILGERNFGLLKHAFWRVLESTPDGATAKGITRRLLIQLMVARRDSPSTESTYSIPGQLVAAALQRATQLHGVAAGTKLLQDVGKSVGLLSVDTLSSQAYTDMLNTLLSAKHNNDKAPPSRSDAYLALLALLRLAAGNTATDVTLRGALLQGLVKQGHHQEAVDLATLCVTERRWLGTRTLNALMQTTEGFNAVKALILTEHSHLIRLLDQAQSVLTAHETGALILPAAVRSVRFMGQEASSNSPSRATPRTARTCSSFELVLSEEEALQVHDGVLDFDQLLPPQDLVLGPNGDTLVASVLNIERHYRINPAAHRDRAVREQLEIINTLGNKGQFNLPVTMDLLVRIARLGRDMQSMLIVNKTVDLAFQLGELSERQRAASSSSKLKYSWQLPQPSRDTASIIETSDVEVMKLTVYDESQRRTKNNHNYANIDNADKKLLERAHLQASSDGGESVTESSQPTLEEIQMLLAVQIAVARNINSLTELQTCLSRLLGNGVPLSERMASDAVSVLLFWGEYDSVRHVFDSLERTEGAMCAAQLASELLSSLLPQNRLLDVAKIAVEATRLQRATRHSSPTQSAERSAVQASQDPLHAALHRLLRHLSLQGDGAAEGEDDGRKTVDETSAVEAVVAIIADSIDTFDFTQKLSLEAPLNPFDSTNPNSLLAVELLLQWFRLQSIRCPELTAAVLQALRGAVTQHPRGNELLRMVDAVTDANQTETVLSPLDADIFDTPLVSTASKTRNSRRAPFAASSYDDLEIHDNDSYLESRYLSSD